TGDTHPGIPEGLIPSRRDKKTSRRSNRSPLSSRAIPALSPRRRGRAKLPDYRYPDVTAGRGQGGADAKVRPHPRQHPSLICATGTSGRDRSRHRAGGRARGPWSAHRPRPVASGAVSWASEHAQSLFAAVDGELHGDGITVAVTAIDVAGPVFAASDDMPADG